MAKKYSPPHLLLHTLLGSLSYWGSAVRAMLFAIVLACTLWLASTHGGGTLQSYAFHFIYVCGIFVLFDAGYVSIARALPFRYHVYDLVFFLGVLVAYAFVMIAPYYVLLPNWLAVSGAVLLLVPLFLLTFRLVGGLLFGRRGRS
ncbi:MAG: hypothetical protein WAU02_00095 [Candidatus Saccharimonadales bacterium]